MKYKVGVIGLGHGSEWARAVINNPDTELSAVCDRNYERNPQIPKELFAEHHAAVMHEIEELCASDADIIIISSPDHFHADHAVMAMEAGKHVICEKPLAPTVAECKRIIECVKKTGRSFMTGQVCRYAPGFRTAKKLVDDGRIGELVYIESEYAHNYDHSRGFDSWRQDPVVKREGFLGGGCHALDLTRWIAGDPIEVFAYTNHKILHDWPTADTGVAVAKFANDVIGRIFVSTGARRPYTMRTVIYGTTGTIICDNQSPAIQIAENNLADATGDLAFNTIPVFVNSHNVSSELTDFITALKRNEPCATDVYQGTATVAFAEAALRSAATGKPVTIESLF